ncbi:hypothetical protein BGX28_010158 [Mortierella sp. GBA30]|nr:hypothetical protein BGX28_010158 [Mortierella sp. GBA30]
MKSPCTLAFLATLALSTLHTASSAAIPVFESSSKDPIISINPVQPFDPSLVQDIDTVRDIPTDKNETIISIKARSAEFSESLTASSANAMAITKKFYIPDETGPSGWSCNYKRQEVQITAQGAVISIGRSSTQKPYSCGELVSDQTGLNYGTYSVDMISTNVRGHVTAFFLLANGQSEIDVELTGLDSTAVWANVWKGSNQSPVKVPLGFDASKGWHTYAFEWRKDFIAWYVDGKVVHKRSVSTADPNSTQYKLVMNSWTNNGNDNWAGKFSMPGNGAKVQSQFRNLKYTP